MKTPSTARRDDPGDEGPDARVSGTAAGLLIVLAFSLLPLMGGEPQAVSSEGLWVTDATKWFVTIVLLLVVVFWERRPLRSLRLRPPRLAEVAVGLAAGAGWLLLARGLTGFVVQPLGGSIDTSTADALLALPFVQRVSVVAAAAVSEEVLFRGFLMERVEEITGRAWLAVLATVVLFVGGHLLHFGLVTNLFQTLITLAFALLFLWRRDLTAVIVMHATIDGWHLLAAPALGLQG